MPPNWIDFLASIRDNIWTSQCRFNLDAKVHNAILLYRCYLPIRCIFAPFEGDRNGRRKTSMYRSFLQYPSSVFRMLDIIPLKGIEVLPLNESSVQSIRVYFVTLCEHVCRLCPSTQKSNERRLPNERWDFFNKTHSRRFVTIYEIYVIKNFYTAQSFVSFLLNFYLELRRLCRRCGLNPI